jgi:glycosyltransferase involved in cell wall biosynthesis
VRVSVLIPTRNRLPYLRESVDSARGQRGVEVEIVVSDDGSTDGTLAYLSGVAAIDERVRVVTDNPTPGIFQNVEHLIRNSSGEAYTILGDDDLLDPDFCALLVEPLEADPSAVLAFCGHRVIDANGSVLPRTTERDARRYGWRALAPGRVADPLTLALSGGVWLGFALFRRAVFPRDVFDAAAGTAADWDFAIRAALLGGFQHVVGEHGSYRDHGMTASRLRKREASEAAVRVLSRYRFEHRKHERLRRALLVDRAKRHAFQHAAEDREAARRSLGLYRRMGGRLGPHAFLAALMLRLPPRPARLVHDAAAGLGDLVRTAQRHVRP